MSLVVGPPSCPAAVVGGGGVVVVVVLLSPLGMGVGLGPVSTWKLLYIHREREGIGRDGGFLGI